MQNQSVSEQFVGIDVSKATLDVAVQLNNHVKQFSNDEKGISNLIQYLSEKHPELIVMEATGNYHFSCLTELLKHEV